MISNIKTPISQIYQCIFKPITFTEYENSLDTKSKQKLLFKLLLYSYIILIFIAIAFRVISFDLFKVSFGWIDLLNIAFGIAGVIAFGIAFSLALSMNVGSAFITALIFTGVTIILIFSSITASIAVGIAGFIAFILNLGIVGGASFGFKSGFFVALIIGITSGIIGSINYGLVYGISIAIVFGAVGTFIFGIVKGIARIIAEGIVVNIAIAIAFSIAGSIAFGIAFNVVGGITGAIAIGFAIGTPIGIAIGTAGSITKSNVKGAGFALSEDSISDASFAIVFGIIFGIGVGIFEGPAGGFAAFAAENISFFVFYTRIFYVFPHLMQYSFVKFLHADPFRQFKNSPIYMDEVIIYPLPHLADFLQMLTKKNREQGILEIEFIATKRPTQRKAAFIALYYTTIMDLSNLESIVNSTPYTPGNDALVSSGEFNRVLASLEDLSIHAKDYLSASGSFNKLKYLNSIERDILKLKNSLTTTKGSFGINFLYLAETWSQIVLEEKMQISEIKTDLLIKILNPYIVGNPVRADDYSRIFVGRTDVGEMIKSNLTYNISQKPAIFLYGRRRIGKSSVLLNLHRLLGEQYIPVYIDFQDPRFGESQASFCFSLSKEIYDSLNKRDFSLENSSLENISLSFFKDNPFATLGSLLDETEKILEKKNKLLLICFDEYEKIEECIQNGFLTIAVLNQLRNIIQHRKYFVVLVSGSNEFNDLNLNWSNYLINTKMIEIGFLSENDTRLLITNPIDNFTLKYTGGLYGEAVEQIIKLANCHPFLTQAICYELVNYLNSQNRKEASVDDVNIAADYVLISASAYFDYIWHIECTKEEKEVLHQIIDDSYIGGNTKEISYLSKKDVIEKNGSKYKFKVELMKKWIEKNVFFIE